jgi:preprotein translocase subunit SecE
MNVKVEPTSASSSADTVKYFLAALIVAAGLFGFYWFSSWPGTLRGALMAVSWAAALGVFAFTARGRAVGEFLSEARFELRKVVWPSRQETVRSTGVIGLVVVIISLILGLIDLIVSNLVRWLLGG